ncbi:MAG TPA: YceH family protein [Chitinispirillaceae bacterium]|nr:YceH family protein [Chitinispirillaceae bacterium]
MDMVLSAVEVRVLGALMEKEVTTPEYYPLSLNALINACNQKSNRDPVMNLEESEVVRAIESLREKKMVWQLSTASGRVPKFEHNIRSLFSFSEQESAVLSVLLLRGPQTVGEIKNRTERLYRFGSLNEVEETIKKLQSDENSGPFVVELPRQPGQKENRYMHLFSGEPKIEYDVQEMAGAVSGNRNSRIDDLENDVKMLKEELAELRTVVEDLRKYIE